MEELQGNISAFHSPSPEENEDTLGDLKRANELILGIGVGAS